MGLIITPGGTLPEYSTTNPANAGSGVFPFARKRTGQTLLSATGLLGAAEVMQPHFGFKRVMLVDTSMNSTSGTFVGLPSHTVTGTSTARAFATTNYLTQTRRIGVVTTASTAGLMAEARQSLGMLWRGNAAGFGGFYFVMKFGVPQTTAAGILFFGINTGATIAVATAASAGTNIIGVGKDSGDTNWQIMHNDGSGTATKIDTLVAPDNTAVYALRVLCAPNDTNVYISFENMGTGAVIDDRILATNLPDNTTLLSYIYHNSNNATAATVSFDLVSLYMHTD